MATSIVIWYWVLYIVIAHPPGTLPLPAQVIMRGSPTDWATENECKAAKMKFEANQPSINVIAPYGYSASICQAHAGATP